MKNKKAKIIKLPTLVWKWILGLESAKSIPNLILSQGSLH